MSGEPGADGGPPAGDASRHGPATTAKAVDPPGATAATVVLLQRRATHIVSGAVIAQPDDVCPRAPPARADAVPGCGGPSRGSS